MRRPETDTKDDPREHLRDLAKLKRMVKERDTIDRDSAEWIDYLEREEAVTRRIREWASRSDDA